MSFLSPPTTEAALSRWLMAAIFLVYLAYLFSTDYQGLHYDAQGYWELTGRFFYEHRRFHLLSYDNGMRGYLLPLLLFPFRVLAYVSGIEPLQFTRVLGAGVAAALFGWAVPAIWQALRPAHGLGWRQRVAFAGLGFVFWRDYFNFPLTDFPALLCMLAALWLLLKKGRQAGWMVLVGILCMAAVNMRPVYLASVAVLLVAGVGLSWRHGYLRTLGRPAALFLLGATLVGMPQLLINLRHFGQPTPLVLAWKNKEKPQSLYLSQLAWGLAIQKYETTVGTDYPDPRVIFADPVGQRLMDEQDISFVYGMRSFAQYARAVWFNIPDVAALYGRHLFNGMDLKYPTPYVQRVFGPTLPLSLLNYTVLFAAGLVLLHIRPFSLTRRQGLVLAVLLFPCLTAIPTAMECRFMIALHLLCYAVLCFHWPADWRRMVLRWPVAASYAVFVLLCLMLSANTMWHMTNGPRMLLP